MTESKQRFTASRRSILLGSMAALTGGVAPALLAGPARADDVDLAREQEAQGWTTAAAGTRTSQNGWPVPDGDDRSSIGVRSLTVPGSSVVLPLRSGDTAVVLLWVAARVDEVVETLGRNCWGYSYRAISGTSVWSNHASGTAIDLNSDRHPQGATGTFSATQVARIREVLEVCRGTVRWGGDYRVTKDEMHFEINVPPGSALLAQVADVLRGAEAATDVVVAGDRVAVLAGDDGRVGAREGDLATRTSLMTTGAVRLALGGDRLGVVDGSGHVHVKAGGLGATWSTLTDGARDLCLTDDRVVVRTSDSSVMVKEGGLGALWGTVWGSRADAVAATGDRIGVLSDGDLWVKEGPLGATWSRLADRVSALAMDGDRIAVVQSGSAWVKTGGLGSLWSRVADSAEAVALTAGRTGVLSGGDALVREGTGPWARVALGGVTDLRLSGDRVAVVEDGVAQVKQGGLGGTWTAIQA